GIFLNRRSIWSKVLTYVIPASKKLSKKFSVHNNYLSIKDLPLGGLFIGLDEALSMGFFLGIILKSLGDFFNSQALGHGIKNFLIHALLMIKLSVLTMFGNPSLFHHIGIIRVNNLRQAM